MPPKLCDRFVVLRESAHPDEQITDMGPYFFLLTDMGPPRKMGPQPGISDITTHITCVQTVATPNKALFVGSYFPHQIPRRALCLVHETHPCKTLKKRPAN